MRPIDYVVIRSSRKSISVCVKSDDSVVVRCPMNASVGRIENFLNEKRAWIEKQKDKNRKSRDLLSDVIAGKTALVAGKELPLIVCGENVITDVCVRITSYRAMKQTYVKYLGGRFSELFRSLCEFTGLRCRSFGFRDYRSRWGCCNSNGQIFFNYKLLMMPEDLWEYVAVHELCHTVYMNHSRAFYALVASFLPDYNLLRNRLNAFSRVCRMYSSTE